MYGQLDLHRLLINDRQRSLAYKKALLKTVREGDTVLDVGTGSGLLAFFACQAGAGHVYAVEKTEIITLAKRLAEDNGFAERITFINKDIHDVTLPERVDLIVSELISKSLIGQDLERISEICRERFLKAGGAIIPESVDLFVAPVESAETYQRLEFPDAAEFDLDFSAAQELALNKPESSRCPPGNILARPQIAYRVDSYATTTSDYANASIAYTAIRDGILHGFCTWFSANLVADIAIDNYPPGNPSWDNGFFPVLKPVAVKSGDAISLRIVGKQPQDSEPVWEWSTTVKSRQEPGKPLGVVADYKQSTLLGIFLSHEALAEDF